MGRLAELAGDGDDEKSRTFVFEDEGHTLGNILRSIINHYPDVEFCGYTVPHPAESKMHFRIQAKKGRAIDILRQGLEDLSKVCDHTVHTFEMAMEDYQDQMQLNAS
ncbi:probable DNA-directed RNA polymerases I and III subunit RPAC2 [Copidosoma floridanum]|uniref:probable DNA-directed RNA polymerases I and III subunit RPAC2 n=1 Tax=Copidosoma floridanum TaxID=29053 RepID=UPI0006C9516D|nr:probable DNA-directed RNA polymerases I and III subunit RPAC2 [Copidosoma floridanum]